MSHTTLRDAVDLRADRDSVGRAPSLSRPDLGAARAGNETLDFVKGALVLVMVLYHWLNYFVTISWDVYRYLRFLTPSFILITGFLVSYAYLRRYAYDSPLLRQRLLQRGMKLLLLFAVLNLPVIALEEQQTGVAHRATDWAARATMIFVTGDKAAAFNILVPIAYFLLLAPAILLVAKRTGISLAAIASAALVMTIGGSFVGFSNAHLELLAVALLGLAAGAGEFTRIESALRRPDLLLFGYLLYLAAITIWNALFSLQVVGVCLSVLLIYAIGTKWGTHGALQRRVVELGRYSLFSYITQIAVLQLLRRGLRGSSLAGAELLIPFAVCLVVLMVAVRLMIVVRARWAVADLAYRTVFA